MNEIEMHEQGKGGGCEVVITINERSSIPIYMQIRDQIVMGISSGQLQEGEKLPTVRGLALEIGINTMTVSKAYQMLKMEGYIVTDRRNGAVVLPLLKHQGLSEESRHLLGRVASEAKIGGLTEDAFAELCRQAYRGKE